MAYNKSTPSSSGDTFAYLSNSSKKRTLQSEDTSFGLDELDDYGSLASIFTVISEPQTQEEKQLFSDNKIWGWPRLYKETKPNLLEYKESLLARYIDIPRSLWRIVNDQLELIAKLVKNIDKKN